MSRTLQKIEADKRRLPDWLRKNLMPGQEAAKTDELIKDLGLHTICESGRCPNRNECYSQKTATFMIMGDVCTRTCTFCSVSMGKPQVLDLDEPARVAKAVETLKLHHVVVTSVNRDDLEDEGVGHFVNTIRAIRGVSDDIIIEVLTPDFKRTQRQAVALILQARPHIFNHNVETVPSLYRRVRPQAIYETSLNIFREIKSASPNILTKSGLMLGLGEDRTDVLQVLRDLKVAGCDMLTIGQYLKSSTFGVEVNRYVAPQEFDEYRQAAFEMGFLWVESAPFVRSSFHAKDSFDAMRISLKERGLI